MKSEFALTGLVLLDRTLLVKTGPVDHAGWNFDGVLGYIQRRRFHLILSLIAKRRFSSLLEIGYGSGIFLPTLARVAKDLHGVDIHGHSGEIETILAKAQTACSLRRGNGRELPYSDASFEAIVAVSVTEFIEDLDAVCLEMRRILRPDGRIFIVTPGRSALLDLGLFIMTGASAKNDYDGRRALVIETLEKHFTCIKRRSWPLPPSLGFHVYRAMELEIK